MKLNVNLERIKVRCFLEKITMISERIKLIIVEVNRFIRIYQTHSFLKLNHFSSKMSMIVSTIGSITRYPSLLG